MTIQMMALLLRYKGFNMKIRTGFVLNNLYSSFIITQSDVKEVFKHCDVYRVSDLIDKLQPLYILFKSIKR